MLYAVTSPYFQYFLSVGRRQKSKNSQFGPTSNAFVDTSVRMVNND